jgi:hypothetical protein
MRTQRGEVTTASVAPESAPAGLLARLSLRNFLWLALLMGIASIDVGILRLRGYHRARSVAKETRPDGEG